MVHDYVLRAEDAQPRGSYDVHLQRLYDAPRTRQPFECCWQPYCNLGLSALGVPFHLP